ncbi:MAG: DUF177 domain-containing protein [Candidatus Omnitrophica bacterium]|nr:DUF177 domain-containing protein [Candidatus Omnitrophota bacterium]
MKIHVDKIPEEGMVLVEQLDPHRISLDSAMQVTSFTKPIEVQAKFTKIGEEVFVDVSLAASCEYTCARCLGKFGDVLKKEFNLNYEVKSGNILEIDEDIRQEMILYDPMKVVCRADCKGLCPRCGQNLNITECSCSK